MVDSVQTVPEDDYDAPEEHEETRKHRNWPLIIAKWVGIVLLGIAALVALLLLGLNTGPGKRFITDQIQGLEMESGLSIGIGRIEGSIYGAMTIHDLTLSDPKGVFLTSPEVDVDWRPFAFVGNHVDIRSLTAERMTLERLPEFNETPPSEEPLLPDLDIDIGELRIDRFIAEAPVSGERRVASLAGEAHISDGRAQVRLNGQTIEGPGRAGGDRLALVLDAVPEENRLALDLDLQAPGDGVIAALAGLTEPLSLEISGRGDWEAWNGTLAANLAGSEFARLDLAARDGTFAVEGPTRIARLFDGPTAALLGPVTTIDLSATPEERRIDLGGSISSDAFRLNTAGIVDLSDNSFDNFKATFALLRPSVLAENLSGSGLRGVLTLSGPFATPVVDYTLNANRLVMNDMGLVNLTAEGEARIDSDRIVIPVDARIARITGLDTVAGGSLTNVRLDGEVAIEGTRVLSDDMRLRSDRIDANLVLLADLSTGLYTGAVDGRIDNYRVESVGIFDITTDIDLQTEREGFALEGRVGLRSRQIENESVRDFLGGNAVAGADIRYGSDGRILFRNLTVEAPLVRVTGGSGSYSPDGQIVFNADAQTQAYGAVGVRVAGTITDPRASITAERPDLGIGLANLRADITGAPGGYRLDASGDTDYGPLTADVVLGTGNQLTLDINSANLGGIDFSGSLRQLPAGPFAGRLDANGNGFEGIVRLNARGQYQEALVNLRARNANLPGPAQLSIGSAIIDARVVLYDTPHVVAEGQIAQARSGDFFINAARAEVDYRGGRGSAKVLAEGTSGVPFRVALNAEMEPELWRAAIRGRARGITFATQNPARIIPGEGSYELLPTRIDFGQGNLRLAGTYGDGIKVQSRLDNLDMALVNAFVPGLGLNGSATGSLDFAQANPNAFPRADARLSISNFTRTTAVSVSQPVNVNFVGKLLADGGEARAVIRRRGSVIGRMNASLNPLPPGSGPWLTRLLEAPLGGGIRYNGPADTLFSLAGQPDQRLSGPIGVAADFSCRVSDPCLSGIVRANSLTYENQTYGTRLSDMKINARFDGNRLEITQLQAAAGEGTVSASGYVGLAADSGYPIDIDVQLQDARLARSDALSATATGTLSLTKRAGADALLSGEILLPETRYEIVRQGAAQVPELTGVRFKPPKGPARITGDEEAETQPGLFSLLRLDISLRAADELYVSGMGLESEWSAAFTVSGTSAAPTMAGEVDLIRGTLSFAGRSFELVEGRVQFTGGRTIDPVISLTATEDIDDVTVNVNVTGRAMNPQISFSSVPGLPQDEIVSRILFGSSVGNLSAIQAVQLASSLNSLRGSGGGLNPLGKLRSATGIDRLRILGADETSGRGTALAAGQYITDDIYVELVTDARGFTATQIEISLTPFLSILSQAGGSGGTDVNVQYRKNY
ncbi:translocation/assembly module TamB domain-containing protein [Qipengyuania atrilutea]|uniref:Translocation/assembly module TamB domain-containing protein n=1 Tax=Qipengyuania atrilutea TaxID=2744473 RepID=A0A850HBT5_9SPHN|nr:translocation/assembly module TamB domain-containing protein [Actirhodobacter atriluteus]NVD44549.1 translocation/assembly module TamB domain-containing protein [Actirhodobacter atriluteus]